MLPHTSHEALVQQFINQLQAAILRYQNEKGKGGLSSERARDIEALCATLSTYKGDMLSLREEVETILDNLATGWLFFRTGNSQLKDYLNVVLQQKRFQSNAFLQRQICDLQQEIIHLKQSPANDERVGQLENELETAHVTIDEQSAQLLEKDTEIEQLKEENAMLRKKLLRLEGQETRMPPTKVPSEDTVEGLGTINESNGRPHSKEQPSTAPKCRSAFFSEKKGEEKLGANTHVPSAYGRPLEKSESDEGLESGYVSPGSSFARSMDFGHRYMDSSSWY